MPRPPPGFEWDDRKAAWNQAAHGVSFAEAPRFEFDGALELEVVNYERDEVRVTALGKIGRTLHVLVYTHREENRRIISLRKATRIERGGYIEAKGY